MPRRDGSGRSRAAWRDPATENELRAIFLSLALRGRMLDPDAWPWLVAAVRKILAGGGDARLTRRRRSHLGRWLMENSQPVRTVVLTRPQETAH